MPKNKQYRNPHYGVVFADGAARVVTAWDDAAAHAPRKRKFKCLGDAQEWLRLPEQAQLAARLRARHGGGAGAASDGGEDVLPSGCAGAAQATLAGPRAVPAWREVAAAAAAGGTTDEEDEVVFEAELSPGAAAAARFEAAVARGDVITLQ